MTNMRTKDFHTLVREQVEAIQGGTGRVLIDLSVGSILRAVVEASSAVVLWLQGLILQLLASTRAATSNGADLDSWMADYGVTRLPAAFAEGAVTFSRFTPGQQAVVPIGDVVQTADGAQQYAVTLDATHPAYRTELTGYVLAPGITSVIVPVRALRAGASGNVSSGGVNTLGQAMPGIDTVSNAMAFTSGAEAESDVALRARFVAYVASLSKATKGAVGYAATSFQPGVSYQLVENEQYDGAHKDGYFYLVIDDGSGIPSKRLLASIYNAVDAVRPVTSTFGVFPPALVRATVSMTITTAHGHDHVAMCATVSRALDLYINTLGLGQALTWSRLTQIAYDAAPGVINVSAVLLNGKRTDLSVTPKQVIRTAKVQVA